MAEGFSFTRNKGPAKNSATGLARGMATQNHFRPHFVNDQFETKFEPRRIEAETLARRRETESTLIEIDGLPSGRILVVGAVAFEVGMDGPT